MKYISTTLALLSLTACAPSPSAIAPASMGDAFAGISCRDAQSRLNAERSTLASLSAAQQSASTGDAIGVLLIGVPVSSLGGNDRQGDIATSKGRIIALENRLLSC